VTATVATYLFFSDLWQVDPKLVTFIGNDFRLQAGSPLIDKGTLLTDVKTDFDGVTRPQGSTHDIGAFEYNAYNTPLNPPRNLRTIPYPTAKRESPEEKDFPLGAPCQGKVTVTSHLLNR
jgi:hypothetical protein